MNIHSLATKLQSLRNHLVADIHMFQVSQRHDAQERLAVRELSAMNDRELHDLGICRADIGHVVRGGRA